MIKRIFINETGKLRGGWKLVLIFILTVVFMNLLGILLGGIAMNLTDFDYEKFAQDFVEDPTADTGFFYVFMSLQHVSIFMGIIIVLWFIDKKSFDQIGLSRLQTNLKELGFGLVLGAASIALMFFFLLGTGQIYLEGSLLAPELTSHLIYGLYLFIVVGIIEEVLARGYCMRVVLNYQNILIPVLGSSAIFSVMHLMNPKLSALGIFNIFLVGILFAYMFIKTGNLWMPIGYHITWNFFQGNVFGFSVSGITMEGVYAVEYLEDNIITGGNFGLEGGVLATVVIGVGFLLTKIYPTKKRHKDS